MRLNFLLKTIGYLGFLIGLPLIIIQPLAAEVSVCPKNVRDEGIFLKEENGEWNISVTVKDFYSGNKKNYPARLGLAKLEAFEEFSNFIEDQILTKEQQAAKNDELGLVVANLPESMKFGKGRDLSWNRIKRYLASMKVLDACITKYKQIVFTAIWNSRDMTNINNQIAIDDAFIDFFSYFQDKEKELNQIEKIYPDLYSTEDPNVLIDIIEKNKKKRKF